MYSPLGVPRCNDGVGGILYEFVELTIGIATRQDLVLSLEMFRGVTWLGSICAEPAVALFLDKVRQSAVTLELLSKVVYGFVMRRRDPGVLHSRI